MSVRSGEWTVSGIRGPNARSARVGVNISVTVDVDVDDAVVL